MKNFLLNLSVITSIAGAASYFASLKFPQVDFTMATYVCIYFFVATVLSHYIIVRSASQDQNSALKPASGKFVTRYMLVTVSKFFLSMVILISYVLLRSAFAVPFIIVFASCYFLFTVFEVASLMQFFRGKN